MTPSWHDDRMLAGHRTTSTGGRWRLRPVTAAMLATAALTLTACGGASLEPEVEAAAPSTPAPTTSTTSTTSTLAPTTSTTSTTTSTTSSTTSTTTSTTTTTTLAEQVSTPIAPPADSRAAEPVVEVGRIVIPRIGVDMTMYEGIRLSTLDYGPGHWPGTAMPGQVGNVVVAGHRTSKHKVFRNIDQLEPGDEIIFEDAAGTHVYHVRATEIVTPDAMWIVDPTDTPTVTLFACHPPGSTAKRIVVYGDLVT